MIAISIALTVGDTFKNFSETGFITYFSFYQLLLIAGLARETFIMRKGGTKVNAWKMPYAIWLIMALAFLFMSMDEIFVIHEHADYFIHDIFKIRETALTDRIDDILVGCYGLIGLGGLYIYREELKKCREAFPLFITGFIVMFVMVCLDIFTNRDDILRLFISDATTVYHVFYWLNIIEDILKIITGGIFAGAFYHCYKITQSSRQIKEG